jgi:hypothetical protein
MLPQGWEPVVICLLFLLELSLPLAGRSFSPDSGEKNYGGIYNKM